MNYRCLWRKYPIGISLVVCYCAILIHCNRSNNTAFLGSAVVEIKTAKISASASGPLLAVLKNEGDSVRAQELCAVVDTVPISLKLRELDANRRQLTYQIAAKDAEIASVDEDIKGIKRELDRIRKLVKEGTVSKQKYDKLETDYQTALKRHKAAMLSASAMKASHEVFDVQRAQLLDQRSRCHITASFTGRVLTRFLEPGEMASPSLPIFEIGTYDTVTVDFFVPQPLLAELSLGQRIFIRVDKRSDKSNAAFIPGWITWISDDAEFSPKNIQTRELRNELVFRVRAYAKNYQNLLKRGLPVEIWKTVPDNAVAGMKQ